MRWLKKLIHFEKYTTRINNIKYARDRDYMKYTRVYCNTIFFFKNSILNFGHFSETRGVSPAILKNPPASPDFCCFPTYGDQAYK